MQTFRRSFTAQKHVSSHKARSANIVNNILGVQVMRIESRGGLHRIGENMLNDRGGDNRGRSLNEDF